MKTFSIQACFTAWLVLLGCEPRAPAGPSAGGGCRYRDMPGTCRIESISPSGPNTYGDGFRTLFTFLPDSDREEPAKASMLIGDGKDPTRRYLQENRIEEGDSIRCIRKRITRGPCSPEVYVFPELKNIY